MSRERYDTQDVTDEVQAMRESLETFKGTVQRVVRKATASQQRLRLILTTPPGGNPVPTPEEPDARKE